MKPSNLFKFNLLWLKTELGNFPWQKSPEHLLQIRSLLTFSLLLKNLYKSSWISIKFKLTLAKSFRRWFEGSRNRRARRATRRWWRSCRGSTPPRHPWSSHRRPKIKISKKKFTEQAIKITEQVWYKFTIVWGFQASSIIAKLLNLLRTKNGLEWEQLNMPLVMWGQNTIIYCK